MRLTNYLLLIFVIEIAFIACGIDSVPMTSLTSYILSPSHFNSTVSTNSTEGLPSSPLDGSDFSSLIRDLMLSAGVIFFAGGIVFKNDIMVFAGISSVFLSFIPVLYRLANLLGNTIDSPVLFYLFISPLILLYILAVLSWWRGRD